MMRLFALIIVLSVTVLGGCRSQSLSIDQLQMPSDRFEGIREVYVRALVDTEDASEAASPAISEALASSGVRAAAQFRYALVEPDSAMRVKVDLFRNEKLAAERFRGRHLPEALAMTEPLDIGDDGFIYQHAYVGFRVGPVAVEIRAKPDDPRLPAFAAAYAEFVRTRLR